MSLRAELRLRLGRLDLRADLDVDDGEVVALLGPNGSGKTTVLRALAGLQPLDGGRILLDGVALDDPAAERFTPPEHRPVGVVFQDYLLFAHLSALENVAFGLRARKVPRGEARQRAREWLDRMGLGPLATHRPGALSGGQQQRVALARALATNPRLLLLDEPLAALDAATRPEVRRELRRHLTTFRGMRLVVTHDLVDAYALADRVVVLEAGRVVQAGTLAEVGAHPRSPYVASLVGTNVISGVVCAGRLRLPSGFELVVTEETDGEVFAAIPPSALSLHRARPEGSPRNVWRAPVTDLDQAHGRVRVRLGGPLPLVSEISAAAVADLQFRPGEEIWVALKATEITTYPA